MVEVISPEEREDQESKNPVEVVTICTAHDGGKKERGNGAMSGSEIALLRQQIEEVCQAMQRGLTGYAITAEHAIISSRYSRLETSTKQLELLVGHEEATRIACEIYNTTIESKA